VTDKQVRQMFDDKHDATHQSRVADAELVSLQSSVICVTRCNVTDT